MKKGDICTFKELEEFLTEPRNNSKYLKVERSGYVAVMHVFRENFCGDWLCGDGILFYSDGEVHSAEPDDIFLLTDIKTI